MVAERPWVMFSVVRERFGYVGRFLFCRIYFPQWLGKQRHTSLHTGQHHYNQCNIQIAFQMTLNNILKILTSCFPFQHIKLLTIMWVVFLVGSFVIFIGTFTHTACPIFRLSLLSKHQLQSKT